MGDREQRAKGKAEEIKGRAKRATGAATGDRSTEASGTAEEFKGKVRKAAGELRSSAKKASR